MLLRLQGLPPALAVREMLRGLLGSAGAWAATLRVFVPLLLCGAGVALAFRAGLWNIGAEGQLVVGALAAVAAGLATEHWLPALVAGTLGGALWALLPGWLRLRRGVPEVLATIMLNFLAIELLRYLISGPMQERTGQFPQTETLPTTARLPTVLVTPTEGLHLGLPLALLGTVVLAWLLVNTRGGLLVRAVGSAPRTVQAAGFSASRVRGLAFTLSGAFAGLAGAIEATGVAGFVDRSFAQGTGYAAIAVALLAGLQPLWVIPSAFLFAVLATGTTSLQWSADLPGIDRFALVLQGLVIVAVLMHVTARTPHKPPSASHG